MLEFNLQLEKSPAGVADEAGRSVLARQQDGVVSEVEGDPVDREHLDHEIVGVILVDQRHRVIEYVAITSIRR